MAAGSDLLLAMGISDNITVMLMDDGTVFSFGGGAGSSEVQHVPTRVKGGDEWDGHTVVSVACNSSLIFAALR